ncbi:YciI family protein [Dinghuibacter silviterrae]|nr:YciI family protein [Dinghuibacter silviterrae]
MSTKMYFFLKLHPPRASFALDMTPEERAVMQQHVEYWAPHVAGGTMLVMGPVADPAGVYGIGILAVDSEEQLKELIGADPANGMNRYEVHPMRVRTAMP